MGSKEWVGRVECVICLNGEGDDDAQVGWLWVNERRV